MNLTNHLRRGLLAVVAAASVVGGVGGTTRADNAAAATPLSAAAVTVATHPPTPDGTLAAVTAPSAPRSVSATPGNTVVKLAWLAPSSNGGAKIKYRVQRAASAKGPWKTIAKPTVRRYRAAGLKNGTRYYFRVAARNAAGWSTPSKVISTVPRTVPTAPRSPKATPGNAAVKLAWAAPASNGGAKIDMYRVQRATSSKGPWTTIAKPTVRRYRATGLRHGTPYWFRVAARNAAGWSTPSKVVSAVPRTVPTAPRSPSATPGNTIVKLAWQAPASNGGATIDKYRVQRATSTSGPWTTIATPTTRSHTAGGLTNGTKYSFRIAAHNAAGYGPASTVISAVPRTVPTAPRSPVAIPGYGTVMLTWKAPSSNGGAKIDKYEVRWAPSYTGPWVTVGDTIDTTYTATGINNGIANNFRIRALNAAGWSAPSTVVDTPVFLGVPGAPQACSASQVGNFGSHSMWLGWQPPLTDGGSAITGYVVELSGPLSLGVSLPTSPLHYQKDNLPPGYYVVRVAAVSLVGKSPWCTDDVVIN